MSGKERVAEGEMRERPAKGYRLCVGLMLLNRENQVFVGQRLGTQKRAWQMPQGGIDAGEPPEQAALRELEEEIGTGEAEIIAQSAGWLHYDVPAKKRPKSWRGRFRGQSQKWFALRFQGRDGDINLATDHPEFADWRWVSPGDLPGLIVPFKRAVYTRVLQEFAQLLERDQ